MPLCHNKSNRIGVKYSEKAINWVVIHVWAYRISNKMISSNHSVLSCQGQWNAVFIQNDKGDNIAGTNVSLPLLIIKPTANLNHRERGNEEYLPAVVLSLAATPECVFVSHQPGSWILMLGFHWNSAADRQAPSGSQSSACEDYLCLRDRHA